MNESNVLWYDYNSEKYSRASQVSCGAFLMEVRRNAKKTETAVRLPRLS